jgi:hypothetical protein
MKHLKLFNESNLYKKIFLNKDGIKFIERYDYEEFSEKEKKLIEQSVKENLSEGLIVDHSPNIKGKLTIKYKGTVKIFGRIYKYDDDWFLFILHVRQHPREEFTPSQYKYYRCDTIQGALNFIKNGLS